MLIPGWQHPQGGRTQLESVQDTAGIRAGQCLAPLGTQPATPALLNPAGTGTHHHQWMMCSTDRLETGRARRGEGVGEGGRIKGEFWTKGTGSPGCLWWAVTLLLILLFRSWMGFWKLLPLCWTCKIVRCVDCLWNEICGLHFKLPLRKGSNPHVAKFHSRASPCAVLKFHKATAPLQLDSQGGKKYEYGYSGWSTHPWHLHREEKMLEILFFIRYWANFSMLLCTGIKKKLFVDAPN